MRNYLLLIHLHLIYREEDLGVGDRTAETSACFRQIRAIVIRLFTTMSDRPLDVSCIIPPFACICEHLALTR